MPKKSTRPFNRQGSVDRLPPVQQIYPERHTEEEAIIVDNLIKQIAGLLLESWEQQSQEATRHGKRA